MRKTTAWRQVFGIAAALTVLTVSCAYAGAWLEGTGSQGAESDMPNTVDIKELAKIERLRVSAGRGVSADAMLDYGSILEFGAGPEGLDLKRAFDLYEKSADLGNMIARRRMCVAFLLGQGRPLNRQKAYNNYCSKLTDADPAVLFSTGYDYELGLNGAKDEEMALNLYAQAFQKGSAEAMDALGRIMLSKGKPKNAVALLRQAIFNGSADAMDRLAGLLETGVAGEVDTDEAWWLYVNAARRGNEHARKYLAEHPQRAPLPRVVLTDGKNSLITQSGTGKDAQASTSFSPNAAGNEVFNQVGRTVFNAAIEGRVDLHCYINKSNSFDVCIMQNEFPIGYGYGPYLMALYNGRLTAAERDIKGRPTAGAVYTITYRWVFN